MHEITQPNIVFRLIFASIGRTDDIVHHAAHTYSKVRGVLLTAAEWLDHFATFLPPFLRRPLARTASFLGRSLFAVTGWICRSAWPIYNSRADHAWRQAAPRFWPSHDEAAARRHPNPTGLVTTSHCVTGCRRYPRPCTRRRYPAPKPRPARHQ